jgi:DNA (cytosine-5)-methyltransferase 1
MSLMEPLLTCVDLFSGCGGLSLGLARAGFKPLLFCELSDHAAETFKHNHPDVPRFKDAVKLSKELKKLARKGTQRFELKSEDGEAVALACGEVDLVCGGPPCQGYSRIGHRRTHKLDKDEIPSNHLFKSMVGVIKVLQPKMFLFENVSGILSGRWNEKGKPGEIFEEVLLSSKGFGSINWASQASHPGSYEGMRYVIRWMEIQSKNYGVPQNRPRVLVVGVREDLAGTPAEKELSRKTIEDFEDKNFEILPRSLGGYQFVPSQILGDLASLARTYDADRSRFHFSPARNDGLLGRMPDELKDWYLVPRDAWMRGEGFAGQSSPLLNQEYSKHSELVIQRFKMIRENGLRMSELTKLGLGTKKFSQRRLHWTVKNGPNITVTSLPDDLVHFAENRILTVREWARLQTFPDWFEFKGPRTTGGTRRAGDPSKGNWHRDVPQYTQIGNAVPVRLAFELGRRFRDIITGSSSSKLLST